MIELDHNDVRLTGEQIGAGGRYRVYRAMLGSKVVAAKSVIHIQDEDEIGRAHV